MFASQVFAEFRKYAILLNRRIMGNANNAQSLLAR